MYRLFPDAVNVYTKQSHGKRIAGEVGYPVMIKATLGGGGKGMRTAYSEAEFESAFLTAQSEAKNAFGDDAMYIEHFYRASASY